MRVIMFVMAGRRPNMELQIPLVARILEQHPNVEYHIWNSSRDGADMEWVSTIPCVERMKVINGYGPMCHNLAYRHYTEPQYQDCLFVKLDDDIVFIETAHFGAFIAAVDKYRGTIVGANTVNNGASVPLIPGFWKQFQATGMDLLDIHLFAGFADKAHTWFFDHHTEILDQPVELVPTEDWFSVNFIGFDQPTLRYVVDTIGTPQPAYLSGRPMFGWGGHAQEPGVFGDEGVFQTLPKMIVVGFTVAHLTYGPQNPDGARLARWRANYRKLGEVYLICESPQWSEELPALSPTSCAGPRSPEPDSPEWDANWGVVRR